MLVSAIAVMATCLAIAPAAHALEAPTPSPEQSSEISEAPVVARALVQGQVVISGVPAVGGELVAQAAGWDADATLAYKWSRDGVPITGATADRYRVSSADAGAQLRVSVTVARGVSVLSDPVTVPKALQTGIPTITGTAVVA